ncbi:MAG: hypothetical protein IKQ17_14420 [Kiritimatiellae bacterium]|nr:hypothetical protein [Kiritimatiellia bacterium]
MNKFTKIAAVAAALALAVPSIAAEEEEEGPIGWTPFALSLASPVQLPWGIGNWDVFGIDLGVFYNDVWHMYGLDLALATTVRGDTRGLVLSGVFNYASRDIYAIRATLGANISAGTLYGMDAGGFGYHNEIYGIDLELIGTMQKKITGFDVGLVFNLTEDESCGLNIAGGVNMAKTAYGCQIAGVFNYTDELHGCQIALVNFARECPWGFQIGLVNIIMDNKIKVLPIVNGYF